MLPDKDIGCHRAGFKVKCLDGVTKHRCQLWVQILGKHPQTGAALAEWGCADKFAPFLAIEATRATRGVQETTDRLRQEVAESHDVAMVGAITKINQKQAAIELAKELGVREAIPLIEQKN